MSSNCRPDQTTQYGVANRGFSNEEEFEMGLRRPPAMNRPQGPDCLPTIDEKSATQAQKFIPPVSFSKLLRFASTTDAVLMSLGVIAAIGAGMCFPFMTINFSLAVQSMIYAGINVSTINELACSDVIPDNRTLVA